MKEYLTDSTIFNDKILLNLVTNILAYHSSVYICYKLYVC
jgi:hypothetical protein